MSRVHRVGRKNQKPRDKLTVELPIPADFRCPISLELMKDPVTLSTGITFDRQNIDAWLDAGNRSCPVTKQELKSLEQIPNLALMRRIQAWCVENHSLGVERIPTPRIPATPAEVSGILVEIANASQRGDVIQCRELVKKIAVLGSDSERNRRSIMAGETSRSIFSRAFESLSAASLENCADILEEILSILAWMLPLDDEARSHLSSPSSLNCLVWFLKFGNLAGRRNAVLVVKEVASSSGGFPYRSLMETEGLMEALVKVLREPVCPRTTKASLAAIFYLVSSSPSSSTSSERFVEIGLVPLLLEMLVDSEKSLCERALGVLDGILGCEGGREKAYNHALAVPVLVKKIIRVSDLATEFAISALWKLCKNCRGEDGGVLLEALHVGAFQKVLLVVQIGCSERTKEKASELLKLLNVFRERGECIDSMDFKQLKRPF